jgi:hypothetical protein
MSSAEAVLIAALELLGLNAQSARFVTLVETPVRAVSANAVAYVTPPSDTIYLVMSSPVFMRALRAYENGPYTGGAPYRLLASVLAHEFCHTRNRCDEQRAYERQLTTLTFLGCDASCADHQMIKQSMFSVLRAAKHRRLSAEESRSRVQEHSPSPTH